jgi:endonuclease/exonuclease/phosphatase family metal-dependent hydrolase
MIKILFSNLGYATGIDGSLHHHVTKVFRHAFQNQAKQRFVLAQFQQIIQREAPDICCMVEMDQGSFHSNRFNQIEALTDELYPIYDIADKYGPASRVAKIAFHVGKSNGFIARRLYFFEKLYFTHGTKRLIYKIILGPRLTLFFTHFSLNEKVRALQFSEIRRLIERVEGDIILLGDFNIMGGVRELAPLLEGDFLRLLNIPTEPTFRFHRRHHMLDLCLCSPSLVRVLQLRVIPQSFSDHCALVISYDGPVEDTFD